LKQQVEKAKSLPDDELLHFNLDDVKEDLDNLDTKELPEIDESLYELERKLRKAMN
jgi:hypothetical protein